jgi:hypothetical protein
MFYSGSACYKDLLIALKKYYKIIRISYIFHTFNLFNYLFHNNLNANRLIRIVIYVDL